ATQFGETLDPTTWAAYEWALEHAPSLSLSDMPTLGAVQVLLGDALTQVLDHDVAADQALRAAQAQLPAILAAQSTPAPEDLLPVTVATPPPQTAPPGTTLVRFGAPQHQVQTFQPLANAFQPQHPEILVVVQPLEQDSLAAAAQAMDCLVWSSPPRTRADRHALVDLQPLIDADAQFPRDAYPAALLAPYQAEGRLVGLPLAFSLDVLYYQATAFAATGLEPPTAQWTLADFLAAAQALTTGTGDQRTYGYASSWVLPDLFFFLNQFGARLVTGSGADLRPNFDDPQVVAALQWYLDLSLVYQVMPAPEIAYRQDDMRRGPSDTAALFQTGAVGMWRDAAQTTIPFPITLPLVGETPATPAIGQADAEPFTIAMAPLPIGQTGLQASDLGPRDGLHITTQAPDPQACWTWLQFLAGSDALVGTDLPARRSMLTAPDFAARAPQAQAVVGLYGPALTQSDLGGVALQGLAPFEPYWLLQALDNVLQGQGTLEENLAVAQQISLNYLACRTQTPEQALRQCALQADPDYQGFVAP
ncbi:MAG: extracellular solute-binding protein, partial [Chloroflexales bacterium]|nr:extracellular solute-binding protein [Chloroflexales bacterium]